ncbi:MAG: phenylalanine--tRNA ligase subunit beta [Ginsengibacter sp.]
MKISYKWLKEYLPVDESINEVVNNSRKIGDILTLIGLEVEHIEHFESVKGNLKGVVTGQVISCEKHPDADKLKVTIVNTGDTENLQIVCGAPNVAQGQKVLVALPGSTIYPKGKNPLTINKVIIRGVESNGMLCAEDELGIGASHAGIIVLPEQTNVGLPASDIYEIYDDYVYEIGLTPNRMDAMSHMGVAKDITAYLSHHFKKELKIISPFVNNFEVDNKKNSFQISLETSLCERYSGVHISGVKVTESPTWLQLKLKSIGLKPINNIVDITNFVLHETGQPLHAFDAQVIKGAKIIVAQLPEGTPFKILDGSEIKLNAGDIIICDSEKNPLCLAGIIGGVQSGVQSQTTEIFLESAVFNAPAIRRSLVKHNQRTDAAIRFEKGVNIDNTVLVLKRAASLIKEIAGGKIEGDVIDVYPQPRTPVEITLSNHYLKKISGKNYHADTVKNILKNLNFKILKEGFDDISVQVPFSNPDILLPVDIIEEIMRIDGLDQVEIPSSINMSPAGEKNSLSDHHKQKVWNWLTGNGFKEIFTNSITNSRYFSEETLATSVKIINSLSEGLDIMRPSMIPTGLESIAYNLNRQNDSLKFAEFGKTYFHKDDNYIEKENFSLFITGDISMSNWNATSKKADLFYVKGICDAIFSICGIKEYQFNLNETGNEWLSTAITANIKEAQLAVCGKVRKNKLAIFSIKQPIYFINFDWEKILEYGATEKLEYLPVSKFPQVHRDLSMILSAETSYQLIADEIKNLKLPQLNDWNLFDFYEGEKIGKGKKSLAVSLTFIDKEKTLTDKEIDKMIQQVIEVLEKNQKAIVRKNA